MDCLLIIPVPSWMAPGENMTILQRKKAAKPGPNAEPNVRGYITFWGRS